MKKLGYLLVFAGFIGTSLVSVVHTTDVDWLYFIVLLLLSVIGIVILRKSEKQETQTEEAVSSNMSEVTASLEAIVKHVKTIKSEVNMEHPQATQSRIDDLLPKELERFVESRKVIGHVHGLQNYANVMSAFATGERYINRVWSASTDGYIDEVVLYVEKSEEQFEIALSTLKAL